MLMESSHYSSIRKVVMGRIAFAAVLVLVLPGTWISAAPQTEGPAGTLTVSVTGPGTVTGLGSVISCPPACTASFHRAGYVVTLTAVSSPHATFSGWGGACSGTTSTTCTVAVTGAVAVSAAWAGISTGASFTNSLWGTWSPAVTWVDVRVGNLDGI
jgi:hypothetical protein